VEETLSLEGEIVRYPSVSLSLTLSINEKVPHIRKKTHKLNALRLWVEGGVIPLYVGLLFSFLFVTSMFPSSNFSNKTRQRVWESGSGSNKIHFYQNNMETP